VIDDAGATTLAAASTLTPEIRAQLSAKSGGDVEAAKLVGTKIAELCKQKNIDLVCFDRGGFLYHGRVQALADAAREGGLSF
jgi:large subunit ribosomal protein L18